MSCFSFYLYLLCFFFYKIGEQEGGTGLGWGLSVGTGGREEVAVKDRRMNKVQTVYTHVCKCKNETC
jgi:hypothetical protein